MSRTLVCAIQIGTSRICAAAAWRDLNGSYTLEAIEHEPTAGCVRRGCVVNVEQTAARIKTLVQKLSYRVKNDCPGIDAAYVGISGISMHSVPYNPTVELTEGRSIDSNTLMSLRQKSLQHFIPGYDVFGVETTGYTLDDIDTIDPTGLTGSHLEAHHQLIVGQKRLKIDLRSAMEQAGVRIIDVIATPLTVSRILTPEEKQKGCVLVDIGHSLTTVSIYLNGALQYLNTIPLGGNAVTTDIASKGGSWEEAENEKRHTSALDMVIRCRYEEIVANVKHQIELSGCQDKLAAGCILTGAASLQKDITTLFGERLGVSLIKVCAYSGIVCGLSDRKPQLAALTTMLESCTANCAMDRKKKSEIAKKMELDLFGNDDFSEKEKSEEEETAEGQTQETHEETVEQTNAVIEEEKPKTDSEPVMPKRRSGFSRFLNDLFSGIDE